MKRLLTIVMLICAAISGVAQTSTPNLNLIQPPHNYPNWDVVMNANLTKLDTGFGALLNQWQGNWSCSLNYNKGQQVFYSNVYYISLQNGNTCQTPGPTSAFWTAYLQVNRNPIGAVFQVDQFSGGSLNAQLQSCLSGLPVTGGTCDARNFGTAISLTSNITVNTPNAHIYLPCATITTAYQFIVPVGIRNVRIDGCSYQGGSNASGTAGGTVWVYTGSTSAFQIGDPTGAANTNGFSMSNVNINTTTAGGGAVGIYFYRAQEVHLDNIYLNGSQTTGQVALLLNGIGNYTGGLFEDIVANGFGTAIELTGDSVGNWANASTFVKVHLVCPESGGDPISGTIGIELLEGDGNTFSGGDVEGCDTMTYLGPHAVNNGFFGLRNEVSNNQYVTVSGSQNNNIFSGTPFYYGQITDNGSRNSFQSAYTDAINPVKGETYNGFTDSTLTNHYRVGIGLGNERGLLWALQTDYGYRWSWGFDDGTSGLQTYSIHDSLNGVDRLSIGQYIAASPGLVLSISSYDGGCFSSNTVPTVTISGGGGSGAAATVTMAANSSQSCNGGAGYQIETWIVTNQGSGYTSQPAVTVTGGNLITAPGTVVAEISTSGGTNDQTVINAAGTGAVVINGGTNSGTGGLVVSTGGPTPTASFQISSSGNTYINGDLTVVGPSQFNATNEIRNNVDAEVDYALWAGATENQHEGLTYKDYNGNSVWYALKDQNNNYMIEGAVSGIDALKAYLATNGGDLYLDAAASAGAVRVNYEAGGSSSFVAYDGTSAHNVIAAFTAANAIRFPGLAAGSGTNCLQADTSGYLTITGSACAALGGAATWTGLQTWTANGNIFNNNAASENDVIIQAGTGGTDQNAGIQLNSDAGTDEWKIYKDASETLHIKDMIANLDRFTVYSNSGMEINTVSTHAITINNSGSSGTGAFAIYEGGANSSVLSFQVSGLNVNVGGASGNGTLIIGNHLNQYATGDFGGTCSVGTSATSCTVGLQHSFSTPACFASPQGTTPPTVTWSVSYASGDITVTTSAAPSTAITFALMCIGNPN
jgi:hypothetical protein